MNNVFSIPHITPPLTFNSFFYFLSEELQTSGYEVYNGGGFFGITPSSWKNMGIFSMFRHMTQPPTTQG
jgi:hypothetical protein